VAHSEANLRPDSTPAASQDKEKETEPRVESVLIAEDDPIFRHVLEAWLKKWHYEVVAVEDGVAAWDALQQEHAPQMAILDWVMPGMDGPELCRRLRAQGNSRYHYILLVTAKDDKQDVVAGLEAGADDYLTKPFNVEELRARIRAGARILHLQDALLHTQDALRFEAAHDPLTGLWNRRAILELLRKETVRTQRSGDPLGVMMADLDHFKRINDSYGHIVGDTVLQECARRMAGAFRSYDCVGRYGGEEFLIVIPGCNATDLFAGGERLRSIIATNPVNTSAGEISVTLSIGGVSSPPLTPPLAYESLLASADEALYQAKAKGRNRMESAAPERVVSIDWNI
jgi:two-component system cell cycle response regulator